jgi:hypothetical protein
VPIERPPPLPKVSSWNWRRSANCIDSHKHQDSEMTWHKFNWQHRRTLWEFWPFTPEIIGTRGLWKLRRVGADALSTTSHSFCKAWIRLQKAYSVPWWVSSSWCDVTQVPLSKIGTCQSNSLSDQGETEQDDCKKRGLRRTASSLDNYSHQN